MDKLVSVRQIRCPMLFANYRWQRRQPVPCEKAINRVVPFYRGHGLLYAIHNSLEGTRNMPPKGINTIIMGPSISSCLQRQIGYKLWCQRCWILAAITGE